MGSKIEVFDAKLSTRTTLHTLRTIREKLLPETSGRYELFNRTVFGPWLDIRTKDHDNHLLNYLLQHQRYIKDPRSITPFIFDIGRHSLEFGRREFCLVTGFCFGDASLSHLSKGNSVFSKRVFPKLSSGIKGTDVIKLFNSQDVFDKLSDDDAVRVCLLLALQSVFMGQELKTVIPKEILVLVDDLNKWDAFPWGEYIWNELHKRVYNLDHKHRRTHLDKLKACGPDYKAKYTVQGFVFAFKIWLLETFPNSREWWIKEEKPVLPRCVAWSDNVTFNKGQYDSLFNVRTIVGTLSPTKSEMNTQWWKSSLLYFHNENPSSSSPTLNSKKRKPTSDSMVVSREIRTRTQVNSDEGVSFGDLVNKVVYMRDEFRSRLAEIGELVKQNKQSNVADSDVDRLFVDDIEFDLDDLNNFTDNLNDRDALFMKITDMDAAFKRRLTSIEEHFRISSSSNYEKTRFDGDVDLADELKVAENPVYAGKNLMTDFEHVTQNQFHNEEKMEVQENVAGFSADHDGDINEENVGQNSSMLQGNQQINSHRTDVVQEVIDDQKLKSSMHEVEKEISNDEHPNLDTISLNDITFDDLEYSAIGTLSTLHSQDFPLEWQHQPIMPESTLNQSQHQPLIPEATVLEASNFNGESVCTDSVSQDVKGDVHTTIDVGPIRQPSQRETKDSRFRKDPYMIQPDSTLRQKRICAKMSKVQSQDCHTMYGPDGEVILPWVEDLSRAKYASTTHVTVPKDVLSLVRQPKEHYFSVPWSDSVFIYNKFWSALLAFGKERNGWLSDTHLELWVLFLWKFRPLKADWAIAGPFFSTLLREGNLESAMSFADGLTYGYPWYAESVDRVYFPINAEEMHWVLAGLELRTGIITLYDSLPPNNVEVEVRPWWINTRKIFEVELLKLLIRTEVMSKKKIDPATYRITFRYELNVPRQGRGDCGIWVMRNMYRLVNNQPLEVENPIQAGLAYREHLFDFFWKYKKFQGIVEPRDDLLQLKNVC